MTVKTRGGKDYSQILEFRGGFSKEEVLDKDHAEEVAHFLINKTPTCILLILVRQFSGYLIGMGYSKEEIFGIKND